jgi:uncharacterized membrane protein YecN with MAPEG domain
MERYNPALTTREKRVNVSEEQNQSETGIKKNLRKPAAKATQEQALGPQKSYWPLGLALTLIIFLLGIITNLVFLVGIGVVLTVAAVIGWGLEQRK